MGAKAGWSCQIDLDSLPSQFVKGSEAAARRQKSEVGR
jgi:hypothetical protein